MLPPVTRKTLRGYQSGILARVRDSISEGHAPLVAVPTGAGKTVIFCRQIAEFDGPSIALAHRRELIAQISRGLASEGVEHQVVAPEATIRMIAANNANSFGRSFVSPGARAAVGSVDSIKNIDPRWAASKRLLVQDEAHHVLAENKWGRAIALFPRAALVGWTATPERADGKGLGKDADGLFTAIICGPTMRELIDQGHLSDYRIYAPTSASLDLSKVAISKATGDYSAKQLRDTVHSAGITGDVVAHYKRLTPGQLGLTFTADVAAAEEMAQAYRDAGVPAEALSAKTPPAERAATIKRFARREILQLVNVDLFGEGFDLSAAAGMDVCVDVVSMARPTHSFVLFAQQFGRALRLGSGKSHATIIDHVGNVVRHRGPPDFARAITLDGRDRKRSSAPDDVPNMRTCLNLACLGVYLRELGSCPYCGSAWIPEERSTPEAVDGDLTELDPTVLARLRADAERAVWGDDETRAHYSAKWVPEIGVLANVKRQRETREAQDQLRDRIAVVCGQWRAAGAADGVIYRRFYVTYGIDIASACGLRAKDALVLLERIKS